MLTNLGVFWTFLLMSPRLLYGLTRPFHLTYFWLELYFQEIRGDAKLKEENGKELQSLTVFRYTIQYLKQHLVNVVRNSSPDVRDTDVRWVITVPAIWKDSAKKFMRQAAEEVKMLYMPDKWSEYLTCLIASRPRYFKNIRLIFWNNVT